MFIYIDRLPHAWYLHIGRVVFSFNVHRQSAGSAHAARAARAYRLGLVDDARKWKAR